MVHVEARLFNGTKDVLPEELLGRQELLRHLITVFETFGFAPLETPAMEYLDILLGKYGPEGEKLIYKLAYKGGEVLALRYDLTVPLSRVVAMRPELPLPFKRYQVQPVWRADRPQPAQGRFREFIQCDVDTVGSASLIADAENVAVVHDGMLSLGIDQFVVRLNSRKLLSGIVAAAGLPRAAEGTVLRIVDKLDKIGVEGVRQEIAETDLDRARAEIVLDVMAISGKPRELLSAVGERLSGNPAAEEGVRELSELLDHTECLGVGLDRIAVDLHLTRGLDYYTGPIYEVGLTAIEKFGSLGGGGRYDDLMGLYGGASVPATGVSIGLSRVLAALVRLGRLSPRQTPTQVLVMRFPDTPVEEALRLLAELRRAKIPSELFYEPERLKKQFQYAEKKGIPWAAVLGVSEVQSGTVNLKELASGNQETVARADLIERLRSQFA